MTNIRRTGIASATTLLGLVLALALTHAIAPNWARRAGLDIWHLPQIQAEARAIQHKTECLEVEAEQWHQRNEAIAHLTTRLATGGVSLAAATDEIEPFLRSQPGFENAARSPLYKAPTFRLSAAQYLLRRVECCWDSDPNMKTATMARLEAEYSAMKESPASCRERPRMAQ